MVNGDKASTWKHYAILLEQYGDDFIPNLNMEWEDIEYLETLLAKAELGSKWDFKYTNHHT